MDLDITALDDATALRVLATIARARMHAGVQPLTATPELRAALSEAFAVTLPETLPVEGEIARLALLLLAEDPATHEAIVAICKAPAPPSFTLGADVAILTLALVALQTHVRLSRDAKGKWSVYVEKKPLKDNLLTTFVRGVLGLFGKK